MFENGSKRPPTFEWWHCWKQEEISAVFLQLAMVVWKWQKTDHQPFSGDFVGKRQKFRPFSNNHNQLFENGRKQTINNSVGTLLENGRNFGRFPTTGFRPFSNNPKCFGRFPTNRFRPFSNNFFRPFSTSPFEIRPCGPLYGLKGNCHSPFVGGGPWIRVFVWVFDHFCLMTPLCGRSLFFVAVGSGFTWPRLGRGCVLARPWFSLT